MSKGNTFAKISPKDVQKSRADSGCINGITTGTSKAARRFIRTVYVVIPGTSPPSLRVTTAAAVAVGQIKQSIALSISTTLFSAATGSSLTMPTATSPSTTKRPPWISSSHQCHLCGLRSFGSIVQNVRKSIRNISSGCITPIASDKKPPRKCSPGREWYIK